MRYYHFDALGSTVLVTNGSGTVSQTYAYDAWGNALSGGDGLKPYQYVGELGYYTHSTAQGDALVDLMQLGVRFYDPVIGRFTQRDPIKDGLNCYMYAGNNSVVSVDPEGLSPLGSYQTVISADWYTPCKNSCMSNNNVKELIEEKPTSCMDLQTDPKSGWLNETCQAYCLQKDVQSAGFNYGTFENWYNNHYSDDTQYPCDRLRRIDIRLHPISYGTNPYVNGTGKSIKTGGDQNSYPYR